MSTINSLYKKLTVEFADELELLNYAIFRNEIELRNDNDNTGEYIAKWEYSKPVPESLQQYVR